MIVLASIRLAVGRLRVNALRSVLTVLGVVIGVAAVVTLVAIGRGSAAEIYQQFSRLGADALTVVAASTSVAPLSRTELEALGALGSVEAIAPVTALNIPVTYGTTSIETTVLGSRPELALIDRLDPAAGRFFDSFHDELGLRVAVLGWDATVALGLDPSSAPGTVITLGPSQYTIIGVLRQVGGGAGLNPDNAVLVPLSSLEGRLLGAASPIGQIRVAAADGATDRYEADVTAALRAVRGVAPSEPDDFEVIDPTSLLTVREASSLSFTRLITAIAAISLVVGGIGVANVMLVAVRERTREIGIRRALGARRRDIVVQFLTESIVLSLAGGLFGVALGIGVATAVPMMSSQQTSVSYPAALLALITSGLVGIAAGLGPANQAASIDPAMAVRYE